MKVKVKGTDVMAFLSRMFYLAWQESEVGGMGFLQDRGDQPEELVFENIQNAGDYAIDTSTPDALCADYVFGRMMKLTVLDIEQDSFELRDETFNRSYQSFAGAYPTPQKLLRATCESLGGIKLNIIDEEYEVIKS